MIMKNKITIVILYALLGCETMESLGSDTQLLLK
jgi:hypothetical protein